MCNQLNDYIALSRRITSWSFYFHYPFILCVISSLFLHLKAPKRKRKIIWRDIEATVLVCWSFSEMGCLSRLPGWLGGRFQGDGSVFRRYTLRSYSNLGAATSNVRKIHLEAKFSWEHILDVSPFFFGNSISCSF